MKTKKYSNPPRKPMMYGGMAAKPRKKMEAGGKAMADAAANADVQSRVATGRATAKDKELAQQQRRESLTRQIKQAKKDGDTATLARFKKEAEKTGQDAMIIRGILQDMGMAGRSPGDQETTN